MSKAKASIFVVLLLAITVAIIYRDNIDIAHLKLWIKTLGIWGPISFVILYIIATILVFPVALFTLVGGALFGPLLGTFYNLTAASLGATFALLLSRYLLSDWVANRSPKLLTNVIDGVNREGWQFVAFIRLVPLFPFNLVNYAFGLTRISIGQYFVTSYIFMFPGCLAYTYLGFVGSHALSGDTQGLIQKGLLGISLLAIVLFIPRWIMKYRRNKENHRDQ